MNNRELFQRDPIAASLMNNGQARIDDARTARERETLREELSNFVCEGQYADGMLRILDSYLQNIGNTSQPAGWVSGFYGSGKSHLLKMLCHLWVNTEFPEDGATARSLVPALPSEIEAAFRELDTQGRRLGGVRAASGTLPSGGGGSVRLTTLGIVLRSMGLPETFAQAKFCLYLRNNGFFDPVKAAVEAAGKDFLRELNNLYVSPVLHDALIAADPGFGDRKSVRELLKQDFAQRNDITTGEFIQTMREVLASDGQPPCTVIVLDEVQQYIANNTERGIQVTEVAEALCKQLDSRVMLVGAGQTALSGLPALGYLRDRFTIAVELSDVDVDTVVRRILLAKRPDKVAATKTVLDAHDGEIFRQLAGTKIAPRNEDRTFLVDDYPLLPVRRRFWEHCLRAIDAPGTTAQLRSQLRVVHEALRQFAERPLGIVVPADFMFEQLQPGLLSQGVLLREIDETIRRLDDGTDDRTLAHRLCGLIFLIRKLPREAGIDIGVRATPEMLADLLVSDLGQEGAELRRDVPGVLNRLVDDGVLLNVDGEFNLQTRESAEWDKEFRNRQTRLNNNEHEIHAKREASLRDATIEALKAVKLQQGDSKEPRKVAIHFGEDAPDTSGHDIPVWVRDGWSCAEKDVLNAARAAGTDSAIVFVFVPKANPDDLKKRIVDSEAAKSTLEFKGNPSPPEGQEARDAMKTRMDLAESGRDGLIKSIVAGAKVLKGGGTEVYSLAFDDKVRDAAQDSCERLFPRFKDADHKNWSFVINRAKAGDDTPLQAVDWSGATDQHPVCREVLREIGAGAVGRSLRKSFGDGPYGWPQDAIDGALIVLHAAGQVQARYKGSALGQGQLDQAKISGSDFRVETTTLGTQDKIKLRGLFQDAGIAARPSDDLSEKASLYLAKLQALAEQAGGDPPLPEKPKTVHLVDLRALAGNEQLAKILELHDTLKSDAAAWKAAGDLAADRLPRWQRLQAMIRHAKAIRDAGDLESQADAIKNSRLVLDATDRVSPLLKKTAEKLRNSVTEAHGRFAEIYRAEFVRLEAGEPWRKITKDQRKQILAECGIAEIPVLAVGSDDDLARALDATPIPSWQEKTDALPHRFGNAAMKAAALLEPKVQRVRLSSGTLKDENDVKRWLSEQEPDLVEKLADGPIVIG